MKVITDKSATAQSTVVTKMCSLLFSCFSLSVLHAEECAATSRNVVKRLANPNRVNCLLDVIRQSNRLGFLQKTVRGTEKRRRLCRGAVGFCS